MVRPTRFRYEAKVNAPAWRDALDVAQKVAALLALLGAAVWFMASGEPMTKMDTDLTIEDHAFADKPWTLLVARINLQNVGKRNIKVKRATARLYQVLPIDRYIEKAYESGALTTSPQSPTEFDWPQIQKLQVNDAASLDSGEKDSVAFEFLVPKKVQLVKLDVEIADDSWWKHLWAGNLVWRSTAMYEIKSTASTARKEGT